MKYLVDPISFFFVDSWISINAMKSVKLKYPYGMCYGYHSDDVNDLHAAEEDADSLIKDLSFDIHDSNDVNINDLLQRSERASSSVLVASARGS